MVQNVDLPACISQAPMNINKKREKRENCFHLWPPCPQLGAKSLEQQDSLPSVGHLSPLGGGIFAP